MENTKFDWCFSELIKIEKGWSNDPDDHGGMTNFGVTQGLMSSHLGRTATAEDMKTLTLDLAKEIYRKFFWDPLSLEQIREQKVAYMILDQAVNRGGVRAVKMLQESLNKNLVISDMQEDGIMGSRTISVVNDQVPAYLCFWYMEICQLSYARVVEYNQSQSKFLRGWLARTHKLQRLFWDKGEIW